MNYLDHLKTTIMLAALFLLAAPAFAVERPHFGNWSVALLSGSDDGKKIADFDFVDFDGKKRKFSEFKGKIILIDFWATWCGPCLADIPKLKKLYETYKPQGFEILGMNSETIGDEDPADPEFAKEAAERARQIVKTRGVNWPQANAETALPIAVKVFGVTALPTKVLVDGDGNILARLAQKDDTEKIVAEIMAKDKRSLQGSPGV